MANILIFVTESHRFGYYESLLEDISNASANDYHLVYDSPEIKQIMDKFDSENIKGYLLPEKFSHLQCWNNTVYALSALNRIFYENFGFRLAEKYLQRILSKQFNSFVRLLDEVLPEIKFDLALISSDRAINDLRVLFYAHKKQIKTAVIPTASYGNFHSIRTYRKTYKVTPKFTFKKKHSIFGKLRTYDGMSYYSAYLAEFLESKGILSKDPFTIGMGVSDYLGCQNRTSKDELLSAGVSKVKIFPMPEPNVLSLLRDAENVRNDYYTEPYLLVSLPQWWEHNLLGKDEHFSHLQRFIDWLKESFGDFKFKISLHPKSVSSNYHEFLKRNELERVEPLKKHIKNASIFASTYSTTIIWALASNVPTVLYDPIGLNTKEYQGLTSVLILDETDSGFNKTEWLNKIDAEKDRIKFGHVVDLNCDAVFLGLIQD